MIQPEFEIRKEQQTYKLHRLNLTKPENLRFLKQMENKHLLDKFIESNNYTRTKTYHLPKTPSNNEMYKPPNKVNFNELRPLSKSKLHRSKTSTNVRETKSRDNNFHLNLNIRKPAEKQRNFEKQQQELKILNLNKAKTMYSPKKKKKINFNGQNTDRSEKDDAIIVTPTKERRVMPPRVEVDRSKYTFENQLPSMSKNDQKVFRMASQKDYTRISPVKTKIARDDEMLTQTDEKTIDHNKKSDSNPNDSKTIVNTKLFVLGNTQPQPKTHIDCSKNQHLEEYKKHSFLDNTKKKKFNSVIKYDAQAKMKVIHTEKEILDKFKNLATNPGLRKRSVWHSSKYLHSAPYHEKFRTVKAELCLKVCDMNEIN